MLSDPLREQRDYINIILILTVLSPHLLEELSGKVPFQFSIFSIILSIGSQEEIVVTELIIWSAAMLIWISSFFIDKCDLQWGL